MINGGGAAEAIQQRGFQYVFQTAARISSYADGIVPMVEKYHIKTVALVSRDYAAAREFLNNLRGTIDDEKGKADIVENLKYLDLCEAEDRKLGR